MARMTQKLPMAAAATMSRIIVIALTGTVCTSVHASVTARDWQTVAPSLRVWHARHPPLTCVLRLGGGGDEQERGDREGDYPGREGEDSEASALGADGLWAAVAAEDDGQQTELPASLQRAVEEALEDGTACVPGAPASTRSSLEAAAWELLKRVRANKRNEKSDDGKEDSVSLDGFDVGGEHGAEAAEAKASVRAARRILQDPAIAAYLDRTHLTQPPADYLEYLQQREDAGSGSARVQSKGEAGGGAAAQWRGNWLGVGGHWTSLMHACRSGAIDVVDGILAHNSSLASLAGTHSEKYSLWCVCLVNTLH